jgi:predicted HTH domain antitoxin
MITIDEEIIKQTHLSEEELKQMIAMLLFEKKVFTFYQARKFAEMERIAFMQLLGKHQIPIYDGLEELQHDIETINKLHDGSSK